MVVANSSYASEAAVEADLVGPQATVATSAVDESASFRRIGVGVLVLVSAVELLWVAFLLFAVVRFV
jgi:hypothetical protein